MTDPTPTPAATPEQQSAAALVAQAQKLLDEAYKLDPSLAPPAPGAASGPAAPPAPPPPRDPLVIVHDALDYIGAQLGNLAPLESLIAELRSVL